MEGMVGNYDEHVEVFEIRSRRQQRWAPAMGKFIKSGCDFQWRTSYGILDYSKKLLAKPFKGAILASKPRASGECRLK
jgi:hypothetical protein